MKNSVDCHIMSTYKFKTVSPRNEQEKKYFFHTRSITKTATLLSQILQWKKHYCKKSHAEIQQQQVDLSDKQTKIQ